MADETWWPGKPIRIIPVGDVDAASEWIPFARRKMVELSRSGDYARRTWMPAPGVIIRGETLRGIPRVFIEVDGYEYISVGLRRNGGTDGLYAGKYGVGNIGKVIDPYEFNSGAFARISNTEPGNIFLGDAGKSLLYVGNNTFLTSMQHMVTPAPSNYGAVAMLGTVTSLRAFPHAGSYIVDVNYGGKTPTGVSRYEAYGESSHTISGESSVGLVWEQTFASPAYTSTLGPEDIASTVIGGSGSASGVPSGDTSVIIDYAPGTTYGPPIVPAKQWTPSSTVLGEYENMLPAEAAYTYEQVGTVVVESYIASDGTIHTGPGEVPLFKYTAAKLNDLVAHVRNNDNFPFANIETTATVAAETYTTTLGSIETEDLESVVTCKFNLVMLYKAWDYKLQSGTEVFSDMRFARWNAFDGQHRVIIEGGEQVIQYVVDDDYSHIWLGRINVGSAVRLSGGRIAALARTSRQRRQDFWTGVPVLPWEPIPRPDVYNSHPKITGFFDNSVTIVSGDNGLTWHVKFAQPAIPAFGSLLYIGGDSILAFADNFDGPGDYAVWRSDNGGSTYSKVCDTLNDTPHSRPLCIAPGVAVFYAFWANVSVGYSRLYRTLDAGATWTSYDIPSDVLTRPYNQFTGRIAILSTSVKDPDPLNPLPPYKKVRLAMVFEMPPVTDEHGATSQASKVIISDDGGETWRVDATVSVDTTAPISQAHAVGVDIGPLKTQLPPNPGLPDMYVTDT